ncbi:MAG: four helix bundle protein [bacterium]|nr:four helix bundle protein [bacterium]
MQITKFENLDCWKEARKLVNMVYELTRLEEFSKDFKLCSQIQAASVSGMSNIAEGFDRKSNLEFIRFLYISLASISEVQSQLYVAIDQKYINEKHFQTTYDQTTNTKNLLYGFIRYLNNLEPGTKQLRTKQHRTK